MFLEGQQSFGQFYCSQPRTCSNVCLCCSETRGEVQRDRQCDPKARTSQRLLRGEELLRPRDTSALPHCAQHTSLLESVDFSCSLPSVTVFELIIYLPNIFTFLQQCLDQNNVPQISLLIPNKHLNNP